ncbi:hypothetical protein [Campylobacter devanensis]|nr:MULTISPECIES: hypothetical protein [unclassified Campylobacter]
MRKIANLCYEIYKFQIRNDGLARFNTSKENQAINLLSSTR